MATMISSPWSTGRRFSVKVESISSEQAKLMASDGTGSDQFGYSVAISGDGNTVLIGTYFKEAAYVFTRSGSTWTQQAKLVAADSSYGAKFGVSVSLSSDGNKAVIGSTNVDGQRGAAYVFTRSGSTWTQQAKLVAADRAAFDFLGVSLNISNDGNTIAVGAYGKNNTKGAAYVFVWSGTAWIQQTSLLSDDGQESDRFGSAVSVSYDGNSIIATASNKDSQRGAAYVFTRSGSTWTQQAKLLKAGGNSGDFFGNTASMSGDGNTVVVGSPGSESAYVYTRSGSTWNEQAYLSASDPSVNAHFGASVTISGDGSCIVVTAYDKDSSKGAAYVFARSGSAWSQKSKIQASDGAFSDLFGHSVSISNNGGTAILGAVGDADKGNNSGSAYIFI